MHTLCAPRARRLRPARRALALGACLLALALDAAPGLAQEEAAPAAEEPAEKPTEEPEGEEVDYGAPKGPPDPYNRGTPQGSMYGFITAAREGDFEKATEFMDLRRLSAVERKAGAERARQLKTVLDQTLWVDFGNLADTNDGVADDGLPAWQDRLGWIETEGGRKELLLQRVPRAGDNVRIWKVSAATVADVPELYQEFGHGMLQEYLPQAFFDFQLLELKLWQWLAIMALLFLAWIVSWVLATVILKILSTLTSRTHSSLDDRIVHLIRNPCRVIVAVGIFHVGMVPLGLALRAREWLVATERTLVILAVTWLLLQLVDLAALGMQQRMRARGETGTAALVVPGKRTVRALMVVMALLFLLDNLGFNVAALIAGLGVGGVAVALAAQKTVENLFGGVTILADRPVRVGDFCKFGDQIGTVEEIGLRSTRIRTLGRTIVTVPNGQFSQLQLENFAKRDQILLQTVLGLRYETTPQQLRFVLTRLREMLLGHPMISPDPARVRFVGFGAYSLDLEVYAYARTADWNEFLQVREDVFLRMMDIVDEAGSGFAFPSSTTYVGRDDGLDEKRAREAEQHVEDWQASGALPFPEFATARRAELEDRLDWPPEGSSGRPPKRGNGPTMGDDDT